MADATLAGFRVQFPELSSTADAVVELALEEAESIHSSAFNVLATLYAAAHFIAKAADAVAAPGGGIGEVTAEYASSLRVEYKSMIGEGHERDSFYASTPYGARFLIHEARTPRRVVGVLVAG